MFDVSLLVKLKKIYFRQGSLHRPNVETIVSGRLGGRVGGGLTFPVDWRLEGDFGLETENGLGCRRHVGKLLWLGLSRRTFKGRASVLAGTWRGF